jgi:hypothetical protein
VPDELITCFECYLTQLLAGKNRMEQDEILWEAERDGKL